MRQLLLAGLEEAPPPPPPAPAPPPPAETILASSTSDRTRDRRRPEAPKVDAVAMVAEVLRAIVADPDSAARTPSVLFQDFQVRCRMVGVRARRSTPRPSRAGWRPRAPASSTARSPEWAPAIRAARGLPDDMLGAFLLHRPRRARGAPCPDDEEIARTYGTSSLGRARRVLGYIEERDMLVTRTDLAGRRSISIPGLGWTTEPAAA